jgi:hypothetical protein
MTAPYDLDRQLNAFLLEGPIELPDVSFDAVRDRTEQTRQRVVVGPWRVPDMNKLIPIGLGAAAVVGVVFLGSRLLTPPGGLGGVPSSEPSHLPSPSVAVSPSASSAAPPLTETFTSERHGFSISYPAGWVARPATEPWTQAVPDWLSKTGDVFYDPLRGGGGILWIAVASQPIGASTPDEWAATTMALDDACAVTEPIAVDGAAGLMGAGDCTRAAVTTDGRGYSFWLYRGDDEPSLVLTYDRAWFQEVLATVQLQPEDAVAVVSSASP